MTERGWFALALGAASYLAGWIFGSVPLYPVALGLALVVAGAAVWARLHARPVDLRRSLGGERHVAGDDVRVSVELRLRGRLVGSLAVVERIGGLGDREVPLSRLHGRVRGEYVLPAVPRGRYPIEAATVAIEDPFSLVRRAVELAGFDALLVYPRLVDVDRLFSEAGGRPGDGRQLFLRRPSGFELHAVRDYEEGESLRRVHWPSTARRGRLMVKDLEDAPRDEALVVLDASAGQDVGRKPESSFELAVSAAGSILRAHVGRGRRAALLVAAAEPRYQAVQSHHEHWELALELLATARADGHAPVAATLAEGAGRWSQAIDVCVVTSDLSAGLADRLLQRSAARRTSSVVYVDPTSFADRPPASLPPQVRARVARLDRAGIPVCVLARGDDLAGRLRGGQPTEAVVG